jgi:hypothetical protein
VVQSLPFKVVSLLPLEPLVGQVEMPRGINIALAALGGTIESATSQDNDSTWAAANLIDGVPFIPGGRGCRPSCGWQSKDGNLPQEVVLSFHESREALMATVVIDTTTYEVAAYGDKYLRNQPKPVRSGP